MLQRTPCKTKKKPGVCCACRDGEREKDDLRDSERGGAVLERERERERGGAVLEREERERERGGAVLKRERERERTQKVPFTRIVV